MLDVNLKLGWDYKGQRGNETLFHTAIGSFTAAMRDWAPAFELIASDVLEPEVQAQFDTAGHGEWAQLAPSTIAGKGHSQILIETGETMTSFRRGDPNHVEEITRSSMQWGSRLARALFHQTGTGSGFQRSQKGPGRGMPMRKILDLSKTAKRSMRSILVNRLATIARREGFAVSKGLGLDPLSARNLGAEMLGL